MLKNEHNVSFWENVEQNNKTDLIPICEPTPLDEQDATTANHRKKPSKKTYNCLVLKPEPKPQPRE